jgi:hypothetical protein
LEFRVNLNKALKPQRDEDEIAGVLLVFTCVAACGFSFWRGAGTGTAAGDKHQGRNKEQKGQRDGR